MHPVAGRLKSFGPSALPCACWVEVGKKNPGTATDRDTLTHWRKEEAARGKLVSLPLSCTLALRVGESPDGARLAALLVVAWYQPQLTIKEDVSSSSPTPKPLQRR